MFPPATPDNTKNSYLYKLLRPELVKKFKTPLCSDSFSRFIPDKEKEVCNEQVRAATDFLKKEIIPSFAYKLRNVSENLHQNYPLLQALHSYGINIRYIGLVRSHLKEEEENERYWRYLILLEMVSRAMKQTIHYKL